MGRAFRPAALAGAMVAVVTLLSGCTAPRPQVTFYGNRTSVAVEPELWCTVDFTALKVACPPNPETAHDGHLTMAVDQPLQISVPGDIGDAPWVVVFEYKDAKGKAQNGRTEVFRDGRLAYTLRVPASGAQLTRVEVQAGLVPAIADDGSTGIAASRTWAVVVAPEQPAET
jgi:hypothetical protein